MARRVDNECAWCAEIILVDNEVTGKDWKIYCSESCRKQGEQASREQLNQVMNFAYSRRHRSHTLPQ